MVQGSSRYQYYSESFERPPHFDRCKGFTSVSSAFYPELSSWYDDVDEELCEEYKQKARKEKAMTKADEFAYPIPTPPGFNEKNHPTMPERVLNRAPLLMEGDRPAIIEEWIEPDMHLYCRTTWYSVLDAEEWTDDEHYDYLVAHNVVEKDPKVKKNVAAKKVEDEEGNMMWSITVVIEELD